MKRLIIVYRMSKPGEDTGSSISPYAPVLPEPVAVVLARNAVRSLLRGGYM